jgi:hypothetical protein
MDDARLFMMILAMVIMMVLCTLFRFMFARMRRAERDTFQASGGRNKQDRLPSEVEEMQLRDLVSKERRVSRTAPPKKMECPLCGNSVRADATKCSFCGAEFNEED